jgi:hypothetical protein
LLNFAEETSMRTKLREQLLRSPLNTAGERKCPLKRTLCSVGWLKNLCKRGVAHTISDGISIQQ